MSETCNIQPADGDRGQENKGPVNLDLSKSEETEGKKEKLRNKQEEAKIVTKVDIHSNVNGDSQTKLDASKRQFTGLTKEELMKYADDPFWVRIRWFLFILFWATWLGMLAGAIAIVVQTSKCGQPHVEASTEKAL